MGLCCCFSGQNEQTAGLLDSYYADGAPPPAPTHMLNLKDFVIDKVLGTGNVGTVFAVRLRQNNHKYALKVLSKAKIYKLRKEHRVRNEREILADMSDISHPLLNQLFCSFQTRKYLCFVIEYCSGGSLWDLQGTRPNYRFTEAETRFYAAELVLALERVHQTGYIYRDIKEENIVLKSTGHLQLCDFELSKKCWSPEYTAEKKRRNSVSEHLEVRTNTLVGTPQYIAPEVIDMDGKNHGYTHSADWWSFGIVLFSLVFGVTPFEGATQDEMFEKIADKGADIEFPTEPKVSDEFKDLVSGLIQKNKFCRLGSEQGADEIKAHAWFSCPPRSMGVSPIEWEHILDQEPPIPINRVYELNEHSIDPADKEKYWQATNLRRDLESDKAVGDSVPFSDFTHMTREATAVWDPNGGSNQE